MATLKDRTIVITGASRGIGREIALKCARDGANLVLAAKTSDPHPKLPGTIHTVAEEVRAAGGQALPIQTDVRFEESVQAMVDETVKTFGGIDVLINNAGAIQLTDLESTDMKKWDLMNHINVRGAYLCAKCCVPWLKKGTNAHILNMSPPVSLDPKWLKGKVAYSLSKYGMTLSALGFAEELREHGVAANSLWPRTIIATAAIDMLMGDDGRKNSRKPSIMADAAYKVLTTEDLALTGRMLIDEQLLRERGYTDFDTYLFEPGVTPMLDFYVEE